MSETNTTATASKRKIGMNVRITDNRGVCKNYKVVPVPNEQLALGLSRAFKLTYTNDEKVTITYVVCELACGQVQCCCDGYRSWGHCKHQEGLTFLGLFQPSLTEKVAQLEAKLAEAIRQIEEMQEAPAELALATVGGVSMKRLESTIVSVGEKLHYVNPRSGEPEPVEVVKVGRDKVRVKKNNGKLVSVSISNLVPF